VLKLRTISLSLLLFIGIAFQANAGGPKYRLSFTIKGLQNNICFLGFYYGDKTYISLNKQGKEDSVIVDANGNFTFAGDTVLASGVYFVMTRSKKSFQFIIDKEQKFAIQGDTSNDFITSTKAIGSDENNLFFNYLRFVTDKHQEMEKFEKLRNVAQMDTLNQQVKRYKDDFIRKHPDMLLAKIFRAGIDPVIPTAPKLANGRVDSSFAYKYYKAHFFDNIDFTDGRLVRSPILFPKIKQYLEKLTAPIADSIIVAADYLIEKARPNKEMFKFIVAYITSTYQMSNIMGMDAVFVHMVNKYYTPDQAYWVSPSQMERIKERAQQLEPVLIGKHIPELVMPDTSNVMQAVDSVKARYTVVYFWDYDCSYCQKETPKLIKWYDSIKAEGIQVYAIETNEANLVKWKDYIKKYKLDWINVSDVFHTSNFRHQFDIISTPVVYLLDEMKKIIAKKIEVEDLNKVLKHDMEQKSKSNK
jgi:peroxiredoxin